MFKGQPGSKTYPQLGLRAAALEQQLARGPFARFEAPIEQGSKAIQKARRKHPSPRFNSMAVKDGRLRVLRGWKASGRLLNGQRRMPRAAASSGKSTLPHALE